MKTKLLYIVTKLKSFLELLNISMLLQKMCCLKSLCKIEDKVILVLCVKERHLKPHMILNNIFYVIDGIFEKPHLIVC